MGELFKLLGLGTPFIYAGILAVSLVRCESVRRSETSNYPFIGPERARRQTGVGGPSRGFRPSVFEPTWFRDLLHFFFTGFPRWILWSMVSVTFVSLIINVVSDFGSLFLIRMWLTRAMGRPATTLIIAGLIGTLIILITFGLRFAAAGLLQMHAGPESRHVIVSAEDISPHMLWEAYLPALLFFPGIVVFAWLPLFAAGILLLRMINPLLVIVRKAQWFFKDGKDHPLEAIGLVAGIIVFVLAALL